MDMGHNLHAYIFGVQIYTEYKESLASCKLILPPPPPRMTSYSWIENFFHPKFTGQSEVPRKIALKIWPDWKCWKVQKFATLWLNGEKIRQQATFLSPNHIDFNFNRHSLILNFFWIFFKRKNVDGLNLKKKSEKRKILLVASSFCFYLVADSIIKIPQKNCLSSDNSFQILAQILIGDFACSFEEDPSSKTMPNSSNNNNGNNNSTNDGNNDGNMMSLGICCKELCILEKFMKGGSITTYFRCSSWASNPELVQGKYG